MTTQSFLVVFRIFFWISGGEGVPPIVMAFYFGNTLFMTYMPSPRFPPQPNGPQRFPVQDPEWFSSGLLPIYLTEKPD